MTLHKLYITLFLVASLSSYAQEKGNVTGRILDAEDNNLPMPFANAFINGTDSGSQQILMETIHSLPIQEYQQLF